MRELSWVEFCRLSRHNSHTIQHGNWLSQILLNTQYNTLPYTYTWQEANKNKSKYPKKDRKNEMSKKKINKEKERKEKNDKKPPNASHKHSYSPPFILTHQSIHLFFIQIVKKYPCFSTHEGQPTNIFWCFFYVFPFLVTILPEKISSTKLHTLKSFVFFFYFVFLVTRENSLEAYYAKGYKYVTATSRPRIKNN